MRSAISHFLYSFAISLFLWAAVLHDVPQVIWSAVKLVRSIK